MGEPEFTPSPAEQEMFEVGAQGKPGKITHNPEAGREMLEERARRLARKARKEEKRRKNEP